MFPILPRPRLRPATAPRQPCRKPTPASAPDAHLLEVIEDLIIKGAHFRSLRNPLDTSTPQGMFSLQELCAVAQLERALIFRTNEVGYRGRTEERKAARQSGWSASTVKNLRDRAIAVGLVETRAAA